MRQLGSWVNRPPTRILSQLRVTVKLKLSSQCSDHCSRAKKWEKGQDNALTLDRKLKHFCVHFRTKFDRNIPVFEDENLPPTYESIFGQIREEWLTAENFTEFLKNAGRILLASLACTLILFFLLILPIAYIVIGYMYLNQCPINKWIPIYLIVAGILGLVQNALMLFRRCVPPNVSVTMYMACMICYVVCEVVVAIVALIWFLIGTYWVYSILFEVCFNKYDGHCYCNSVCYWFAFVMITLSYILIIIILISVCVVLAISWQHFDRPQIEPAPYGEAEYEEVVRNRQASEGRGGLPPEQQTPPPPGDPLVGLLRSAEGLGTLRRYNSTSQRTEQSEITPDPP
eukprot:sb/3466368/